MNVNTFRSFVFLYLLFLTKSLKYYICKNIIVNIIIYIIYARGIYLKLPSVHVHGVHLFVKPCYNWA